MTRDYLSINRDVWNADAPNWVAFARHQWSLERPVWGTWNTPDAGMELLPEDMGGMAAVELGCGTGYVAGWMARRGGRVTAIDISAEQLATAREIAAEEGADITFIEGNAEETGLPDGAFDFAISEYGAAIWCPPEAWLREAWRLLRPGGQLVFLGNHPLSLVCSPLDGAPCEPVLHRPYKGMWGADWTQVEIEPSGLCFNLTMADWFALFTEIGFDVTAYHELYAPEEAEGVRASVPAEWAKRYPVEQVWCLRKGAPPLS